MKLSQEAIKEFTEIYFAEKGRMLSDDEAELQAQRVFDLLYYIFYSDSYDTRKPNA